MFIVWSKVDQRMIFFLLEWKKMPVVLTSICKFKRLQLHTHIRNTYHIPIHWRGYQMWICPLWPFIKLITFCNVIKLQLLLSDNACAANKINIALNLFRYAMLLTVWPTNHLTALHLNIIYYSVISGLLVVKKKNKCRFRYKYINWVLFALYLVYVFTQRRFEAATVKRPSTWNFVLFILYVLMYLPSPFCLHQLMWTTKRE